MFEEAVGPHRLRALAAVRLAQHEVAFVAKNQLQNQREGLEFRVENKKLVHALIRRRVLAQRTRAVFRRGHGHEAQHEDAKGEREREPHLEFVDAHRNLGKHEHGAGEDHNKHLLVRISKQSERSESRKHHNPTLSSVSSSSSGASGASGATTGYNMLSFLDI